jgi:hypothetical protein
MGWEGWIIIQINNIIIWFIFLFIDIGLGLSFFRRINKNKKLNVFKVFLSFWVGYCLQILFLQIIQLFIPISDFTLILLFMLSLIGYWMYRAEFKEFINNLRFSNNKNKLKYAVFFIGFIIFVFILSNLSMKKIISYDMGLYYLQNMKWFNNFKLIPGLAQVHSRFGFNSVYFLLGAQFSVFGKQSYRLVNGLIFLLVILMQLNSFRRIVIEKIIHFSDTFLFILFPLTIILIMTYHSAYLTSPSSDLPIFIFGIVSFYLLLTLLETKRKSDFFTILTTLVLMIITGITIKLSFIVFGGLVVIFAIIIYIRKYNFRNLFGRKLIGIGLLSVLILSIWQLRSVILSGYLFYPVTEISLPVDWKLPVEKVVHEANSIKSWARIPGISWKDGLSIYNWVEIWFENNKNQVYFKFPLILGLFFLLFYVIQKIRDVVIRKKRKNKIYRFNFLLMGIPIISLIFWFVSAPDLRFAGSNFFIISGLMGSIIIYNIDISKWRIVTILLIVVSQIVVICHLYNQPKISYLVSPKEYVQNFEIPEQGFKSTDLSSDIRLNSPSEGTDQCWDAPLPCGPYITNNSIELRDGKCIENGFRMK